jgi:thioredoxin-related protein
MRHLLPWSLLLVVALSSCAKLGLGGKANQKTAPSPFGSTGVPPQLRARTVDPGTPVATLPNGLTNKQALNLTPQEDIVYTDPDNPEAGIPELGDLLSQVKRGPWEQSETIAKKRSVREGKPLLIWFTDSQSNPLCKAVSQELFATDDFGKWATEKLVRLKVDTFISVDDSDPDADQSENRRSQINHYNDAIKKRYKVMGFPSLVMLSPSGEVVGTYRGYKRGDSVLLWGKLKHAEAISAESYKSWRSGLEKKGYRDWHDRKERKVFARLTSYSAGTLALIEPDGTRSRTTEDKLSDPDREWITEQKKIRNLE